MSCVAAILVQPQRLGRVRGKSELDDLANDVIRLISRLAADPVRGGLLLGTIGAVFEQSAIRIYQNAQAGLPRAEQRLLGLLRPLIDGARNIDVKAGDGGAAELLERALNGFADIAGSIDADRLRPHVELVLDVIENDLGLSPAFITDQIWSIVDDIVDRLGTLPDDLDDDTRMTWIEMRAVLKRLKRLLKPHFSFPRLPADRIVIDLLALLRRSGIELVAKRAACIGRELAKGVRAGSRVLELVPPSGFATGTVGAATPAPVIGSQYCWYATHLLATKKRPDWWEFGRIGKDFGEGFTTSFRGGRAWYEYIGAVFAAPVAGLAPLWSSDEVWVDEDRKRVLWGDHVLHKGDNVTWQQALEYNSYAPRQIRRCADRIKPCLSQEREQVLHKHFGYTFGDTLTADFLEGWALYTSVARDFTASILHVMPDISLRKGDYVANIANAVQLAGSGAFTWRTKAPFDWWLDQVRERDHAWYESFGLWSVSQLTSWGPTVFGSLEGTHTNASFGNWLSFQFTQTLADAVKTIQYRTIGDTFRDASLSLFTLLNYEGARELVPPLSSPVTPWWETEMEDTRPDNRLDVDGISDLVNGFFMMLLVKAIPREEYSHPFEEDSAVNLWLVYGLLGGAGMGLVGGFLGCTTAEIIAWAEDWKLLGKQMLRSVWANWKSYWPTVYFVKEGDTDEGRYNPLGPEYRGYPKHDTSPYWLPWANGDARVCGQGNQGMWSHNAFGGIAEQYAYDFGLDAREPIIASRGGTIVDFFDWVPDDTDPENFINAPAAATIGGQTNSSKNNFIIIRHDRDECGNIVMAPPNATHDKGQGGGAVWTYAQYMHGRTGSVRAAFGNATSGNIIGQPVTRGQLLMLAGDTGKSFHNHLHMQVREGPAPTARANFAGDGTTTTFPYVRLIALATDLLVRLNNTTQTLGVHYNVTGVGNVGGGTVVFVTPPAAGTTVSILLRVNYTGDGTTTTFAYPFVARAANELVVMVGGITQTLTTNYTVTGVNNAAGGTVVFVAAPAAGAAIIIGIGAGVATPVSRASLVANTLPFVFRDVTNLFGTDGVCEARTYYTSENPGVTCPP